MSEGVEETSIKEDGIEEQSTDRRSLLSGPRAVLSDESEEALNQSESSFSGRVVLYCLGRDRLLSSSSISFF